MNTHSPFEPGYIGNADPAGAVAVVDAMFPRDRLAAAGAPEDMLEQMSTTFDAMAPDGRVEAARAFDALSDDELAQSVPTLVENFQRAAAYDALSDEDKAALEALSLEDLAALDALTDADREALAAPAVDAEDDSSVESVGEVPGGPVAAVIEWVGSDPARAETALSVEQARAKPRQKLIVALEQLLATARGEQGTTE